MLTKTEEWHRTRKVRIFSRIAISFVARNFCTKYWYDKRFWILGTRNLVNSNITLLSSQNQIRSRPFTFISLFCLQMLRTENFGSHHAFTNLHISYWQQIFNKDFFDCFQKKFCAKLVKKLFHTAFASSTLASAIYQIQQRTGTCKLTTIFLSRKQYFRTIHQMKFSTTILK